MVGRACRLGACCFLLLIAPGTMAADDVRVESELSETTALVRQTVVYTLRLITGIDLTEIHVTAPTVNGGTVEKLGEPRDSYRRDDRRQLLVREFFYSVTPLVGGSLTVPAARLRVRTEGRRQGSTYNPWRRQENHESGWLELESKPLRLEVRMPASNAQVLPLSHLRLRGELEGAEVAMVGEPLTLSLVQSAVGAGGEALPGLEGALEHADLKVYAERPVVVRELGRDGKTVFGQRAETYTLVPTRPGPLRLPEIRIPWWDVVQGRERVARWRPPTMTVGGEAPGPGPAQEEGWSIPTPIPSERLWLVPIIGVALLLFLTGWWVGAGLPGSRGLARGLSAIRRRLGALVAPVATGIRANIREAIPVGFGKRWRERLAGMFPRRVWTRSRERLSRALPTGLAIWPLLRALSREDRPRRLAELLQGFAETHFDLPHHTPLRRIAAEIRGRYPKVDSSATEAVFDTLDEAIYGRQPLDLEGWRRASRRLFTGLAVKGTRRREPLPRRELPVLNPRQ